MENAFVSTKVSTSKLEMLNTLANLEDKTIYQKVLNGDLKPVDAAIYSVKLLDASTKELMQASDNQKEGITNLNNRKMEASQHFMISGIRLLSAQVANGNESTLAGAAFDVAADFILNGELDIVIAGKTAFPRNSCRVFDTEDSNGPKGLFMLDCPRFVSTLSEIIPTLRVNAAAMGSDSHAVRIELIGTKLIPA